MSFIGLTPLKSTTKFTQLKAVLVKGYQVASGQAKNSPYPAGTISMQAPLFTKFGLDISSLHLATLNFNIEPASFSVKQAEYLFKQMKWAENCPAEDFSLSPCQINFQENNYAGYIYYPHPETKPQHFHGNNIIEVIAPFIANISYGDKATLMVNQQEIQIESSK